MKAMVFTILTLCMSVIAATPPGGFGGGIGFRSNTIITPAGGGGGGGCTTTADTLSGTTVGTVDCGGSKYIATSFVAGSSYSVCKAVVRLKTASGTGSSYTLQCAIYSNNGGTTFPSALVGTASATINANTVTSSEADFTFTGMSASLTSGVTYWIVIISSSEFNTTPASWAYVSSAGTHAISASSDGSAWSEVSAFEHCKYTLYQ